MKLRTPVHGSPLAPRLTWSSQENSSGSVFRSQYAMVSSSRAFFRARDLIRKPVPTFRDHATPPIRHTIFHSSAVTGCTERREYFSNAMSLSFGTVFTSAIVTGFLNGVCAVTSVTTHGDPFSAVTSG